MVASHKFSEKVIRDIICDLQGTMTMTDISKKYHITISMVSDINHGRVRVIEGMQYPIRPTRYHSIIPNKPIVKRKKYHNLK